MRPLAVATCLRHGDLARGRRKRNVAEALSREREREVERIQAMPNRTLVLSIQPIAPTPTRELIVLVRDAIRESQMPATIGSPPLPEFVFEGEAVRVALSVTEMQARHTRLDLITDKRVLSAEWVWR